MNASNVICGGVQEDVSSNSGGTIVNDNWILENWFKTWPSREKSSSKEIIEVTPVSYQDIKNNINSVDAITYLDTTQDFILSTLKSKSQSEKDISKASAMHDKNKINSVKYSPVDRMSLDALLESLPLVYNPSTKQLQVVKHKASKQFITKSVSEAQLESKIDSFEDTLPCSTQKESTEDVIDESENLLVENEESPKHPALFNSEFHELSNINKKSNESNNASFRLNPFHCENSSPVPSLQSAQIGILELDNLQPPAAPYTRVNTNTSLSCTDASSFSSITSSVTDASLHSTSDSAVCLTSDRASIGDAGMSKKKRGIADFLTRSVFSWRQKEEGVISVSLAKSDLDTISLSSAGNISQDSNGKGSSWKLFSRRSLRGGSANKEKHMLSSRQAGTVGLIMESRPSCLPAKTILEEKKHKQEYEDMVYAAKKREQREECERQKNEATLQKQEEQLTASLNLWNEIISKWKTLHNQKKCRDLWWNGVPSCVRGKVWSLVIGNELGITPQIYNNMVKRSREKLLRLNESRGKNDCSSNAQSGNQESTMDLIQLDVARTFPQLCIFQKGGPYYDPLHTILCAYVCYNPSVGYVQGMSFLAATLLLNMEEHVAFISFANLLTRQAHTVFFSVNQEKMSSYYATFESLLSENLPSLSAHLARLHVTPDMYFMDWILTVFSRSSQLDVAARIWDVYLRDGEEFLIRAALGILKHYSSELLLQECTAMTAQFLICLPEDLNVDELFKSIASIKTSNKQYSFSQILQSNIIKCSTITNV